MKIVFVALPSGKPWNGATIYNEPLGGSEAAVAYMARAFARRGHHVTVFSHGEPGVFDNVLYQNTEHMNYMRADADVVISSRWPEALAVPSAAGALRMLWCHDMPPHTDALRVAAHIIMFISRFQARSWNTFGESIFLSTDGVDTDLFHPVPGVQRDVNKLVWISNPDRGLPVAARIFQDIRKRWPDLELHVFGRSAVYGWDANTERPFIPHEKYMDNVFMHEPLPRARLAEELSTAWAMFYPTWWPETCCMSAIEAQASGVPVICSPEGALPETVKGGVIGYDYLNAVSQLRNPVKWAKTSLHGVAWASTLTWENIAEGWEELFVQQRSALCV